MFMTSDIISIPKNIIQCWVDGGCVNNGTYKGYGGWAYRVITPQRQEYINQGHQLETTNNQMELRALIEVLKSVRLHRDHRFDIKTDSKYVIQTWKGLGMRVDSESYANPQEIMELAQLKEELGNLVNLSWVKGHSGEIGNEIVDELCTNQINFLKKQYPRVG